MPALDEIPGIGVATLRLLAAAGIDTVEQLAAQNLDHLVAELKHANDTLSAAKRAPGKAKAMKWIRQANELLGDDAPNFSLEIEPPLDLEPELPSPHRRSNVESIAKPYARQGFSSTASPTDIPVTRRIDRKPASKNGHEEDRVALIRAPRAETNLGKDPGSRTYIRGVLHSHPWSLRLGAVFTLLLLVNLPLAVASAFLLLASRERPDLFSWVPEWMLAFPIALPVTGIGYMLCGLTGKCRICNQKLFARRGARKHDKAHRIQGMGFVVPLCLHILAFSWFRCSSCGTPVRLKK